MGQPVDLGSHLFDGPGYSMRSDAAVELEEALVHVATGQAPLTNGHRFNHARVFELLHAERRLEGAGHPSCC